MIFPVVLLPLLLVLAVIDPNRLRIIERTPENLLLSCGSCQAAERDWEDKGW